MLRCLLGAWVIASLGGCYATGLREDAAPTDTDAYLYGRFLILAEMKSTGEFVTANVGYAFRCRSKATRLSPTGLEEHTIWFSPERPLQVVKVSPASCSLHEIVFADAARGIVERRQVPGAASRVAQLRPGMAYYLGDHVGEYKLMTPNALDSYHQWRVRSITNDYATTTSAIKQQFPKFAEVPTEDISGLMPRI